MRAFQPYLHRGQNVATPLLQTYDNMLYRIGITPLFRSSADINAMGSPHDMFQVFQVKVLQKIRFELSRVQQVECLMKNLMLSKRKTDKNM